MTRDQKLIAEAYETIYEELRGGAGKSYYDITTKGQNKTVIDISDVPDETALFDHFMKDPNLKALFYDAVKWGSPGWKTVEAAFSHEAERPVMTNSAQRAYLSKVFYDSIKESISEALLCEKGYDEVWELILHSTPEVKNFVQGTLKLVNVDANDPKMDELAKNLGAYIDRLPTTMLSWKQIPSLKAIEQSWIKKMQQIQGKPNVLKLYNQLMAQRDSKGDPRPGGRIGGGTTTLFNNIKQGLGDPAVILQLPSGMYVIGGRTRLYAALAGQMNIKVTILNQNNLLKYFQSQTQGRK